MAKNTTETAQSKSLRETVADIQKKTAKVLAGVEATHARADMVHKAADASHKRATAMRKQAQRSRGNRAA